MFNIKEELKKLPDKPGVYIMRDKNDTIIYVGKAVILKNRVKQYFMKNNKTARIEKMVSLIDHFEYIVTDSEAEALILECNLIKKNMPKFNVLLKDDKTYPYIKIDLASDYPNVFITRSIKNDGSKYFGPYANAGAAKEMLRFIKERFQIRQCKKFKSNKRACINYDMKRCLAPCVNKISKEEYRMQIDQIIMLLEGKTEQIIKDLEIEMKKLSEKQEYEKAAIVRDRKQAIERISVKQKVSNINENSIDVIGIYKNNISVCVELFFVRGSKMIGREHYFLEDMHDEKIKTILSDFIKQYYLQKVDLPNKIMMQEEIEDSKTIEELLSDRADRRVEFKVPKKGEKLKFVEMAINNAKITLENKNMEQESIVLGLKDALGLNKLPRRIETFDISNFHGEYMVAGMCVAIDGVIKKNLSKRFKIKTVVGQNDVACTKEVITRRLKHSIDNPKGSFGNLPDLILADGGITQIRAIKEAISNYNIEIPVFGMVKDEKHNTKMLINEKRKEIPLNEILMNFITRFQTEVHNTAIEYNQKLMNKDMAKSALDNILGIGPVKKEELLKKFGSTIGIKKAKIQELMQIKGINEDLARRIKDNLE